MFWGIDVSITFFKLAVPVGTRIAIDYKPRRVSPPLVNVISVLRAEGPCPVRPGVCVGGSRVCGAHTCGFVRGRLHKTTPRSPLIIKINTPQV